MAKSNYAQQKKREQAYALIRSGDKASARQVLKKLCQKDRQDIESWLSMGMLLAQSKKFVEAIPYFKHVTNIRTNVAEAYLNLSSCYASIQDIPSAIATCREGLRHFPDNTDLLFNQAIMLLKIYNFEEAKELFSRCIKLIPEKLDSYLNLAFLYNEDLAFNAARDTYQQALAISPGNAGIIAEIANTHVKQGNASEAYEILKPLIESHQYSTKAATVFAKIAVKMNQVESATAYLKACIRHASSSDENLVRAHLSLGQLYDKTREYELAFKSFAEGNALKNTRYIATEHSAYIDSLISLFNKDFISRFKSLPEPAIKPIFIVGMPRSGTTLVEQIICSHPSVYGAGELLTLTNLTTNISSGYLKGEKLSDEKLARFANDYLDAVTPKLSKETAFTDKMPSNALRLGFIKLLFPNAPVIHCLRNPLDTCLSCYSMDFHGVHEYAYDLKTLGHYYNEYRRLMKYWQGALGLRIFDIQYEDLITAQEEKSRELLAFCNIDWDPACLNFHENKRVAVTASNQQVRQPIYKGSMQRWRHYSKQLQPLIDALEPEYRREAGVENWDY